MNNLNKYAVKITALFFLACAFLVAVIALPWFVPVLILGIIYFLTRSLIKDTKAFFVQLSTELARELIGETS